MKSTYIYLLFAIAIIFSACTEELDTDYKGKSDNYLVVSGEISTDTMAHTVKLSRSIDYTDTVCPAETGAIVTISDGEQIFGLSETSPGIYQTSSNVYGIAGKEYLLTIYTASGDTFTARSAINRLTDIDSIVINYERFSFDENYYYKVLFNGQDPAGKGDYYVWNLYLDGKKYNDTLSKWEFQSDDFVDGQYVSDFDIYWLEPAELPNDTTQITVEITSIPKEYYTYISEVLTETAWRGSPFDATPANVTSNIKGEGAVGFFVATQKKRKSIVYIKTDEEKNK